MVALLPGLVDCRLKTEATEDTSESTAVECLLPSALDGLFPYQGSCADVAVWAYGDDWTLQIGVALDGGALYQAQESGTEFLTTCELPDGTCADDDITAYFWLSVGSVQFNTCTDLGWSEPEKVYSNESVTGAVDLRVVDVDDSEWGNDEDLGEADVTLRDIVIDEGDGCTSTLATYEWRDMPVGMVAR